MIKIEDENDVSITLFEERHAIAPHRARACTMRRYVLSSVRGSQG